MAAADALARAGRKAIRIVYRRLLWGARRGLRGVLYTAVTGFAVGALVRLAIISNGFLYYLAQQGNGLTHYVIGIASGQGLFDPRQRDKAIRLATFFLTYEAGEWPLGDPPWQEYHGFAIGFAIGVVAGLLLALARRARRRTGG